MKPKRTLDITLLAGSFFLWSLLGWLRLREAISIWSLLTHSLNFPQPEYLIFSAVCWGCAGLVFALGLMCRWRWARFSPFAALGFVLWYWIERVTLTRGDPAWTNLVFSVGISVFWLAYAVGVVAVAGKRGYFAGWKGDK
jgi:hypothetical protein